MPSVPHHSLGCRSPGKICPDPLFIEREKERERERMKSDRLQTIIITNSTKGREKNELFYYYSVETTVSMSQEF